MKNIKDKLDDRSINGMSSDQIWSTIVEHVNTSGSSKYKLYSEAHDFLKSVSSRFGLKKTQSLNSLALACKAAGDESRWSILGDKDKLKSANEAKWSHLKYSGAVK